MSDITFFSISLVVVTILSVVLFVKSPLEYFRTKEGKGVLSGIVLTLTLVLILSIGASFVKADEQEYVFFKEGYVFMGLDNTKDISPMCEGGVNSDKLTSNIGVKVDLISTVSGKANISAKYTHHSCAFNPDRDGYDAIGIELNYKLW